MVYCYDFFLLCLILQIHNPKTISISNLFYVKESGYMYNQYSGSTTSTYL